MSIHQSVLLSQTVDAVVEPLKSSRSTLVGVLIDCTLGGGGHTEALLQRIEPFPEVKVVAIDQDPQAIEHARKKLSNWKEKIEFKQGRFGDLDHVLGKESPPILGVMADLGYSSDQLEDGSRGMSFRQEGPLDMRLDPHLNQSAWDYLQEATEEDIRETLLHYGEERFAARIAGSIIRFREAGELQNSTKFLSNLVVKSYPAKFRHGRLHAATKTFQALRIKINHEIDQLSDLLHWSEKRLTPGFRIGVITFHSIEDRLVKKFIQSSEAFSAVTKKPVVPEPAEIEANPRSRSAKLRVAVRNGS